PFFLLKNNGHSLGRTQQTGNFSIQKKYYDYFRFGAVYSFDAVDANGNESLKPGTAFYPTGLPLNRKQEDRNYNVNLYADYYVYHNITVKLASTYNAFYSEPAINSSYAPYALTQITPQDAFTFIPATEVRSFTNLQLIQHSEFTTKLELNYSYWITLNADMFI